MATAVLSVVAKANTKRKLKAGASKAAEHTEEVCKLLVGGWVGGSVCGLSWCMEFG